MNQIIYNTEAKAISYERMPDLRKSLYKLIIDRTEQEKKYGLDPWGYKDYAAYLKCTPRTISRHIRALIALGLIAVQRVNGFVTEYFIRNITDSKFHEISSHPELFVPVKKEKEETENHKYESVLDSSQVQLKKYIENKLNISLTDKKVLILIETADANSEIDSKERFRVIMQCANKTSEYKPFNPFGYLKKLIKTYTEIAETEIEATTKPIKKEAELEYKELATSLSLKLECDYEKRFHLSVKQCNALISIAVKRCGIRLEDAYNFIRFEIINQIKNFYITDMFAYIRVMMQSFQHNDC